MRGQGRDPAERLGSRASVCPVFFQGTPLRERQSFSSQVTGTRDRVGLKERDNDPVERQLDEAKRRIGELVMEVEVLQKERRVKRPLVVRRSSR
jgi:hypothetical protein